MVCKEGDGEGRENLRVVMFDSGYCLFRRPDESDVQWDCCKSRENEASNLQGELEYELKKHNFDLEPQCEGPLGWLYESDFEEFDDECAGNNKSVHDP